MSRGRPFAPGNTGRPAGSRHKTTVAIEALLEGEHERLTRKAIELALAGDTGALRLCLDRLAPARRDSPVDVELPPIRSAGDAVEASAALMTAVGVGQVSPGEAQAVMALIVSHKSIVEADELERRIAALEARMA